MTMDSTRGSSSLDYDFISAKSNELPDGRYFPYTYHQRAVIASVWFNKPLSSGVTDTTWCSLTPSLPASTSSKPTIEVSSKLPVVIISAARDPEIVSKAASWAVCAAAANCDMRVIH